MPYKVIWQAVRVGIPAMIGGVMMVLVFAAAATAAMPDDIKQRFQLLDSYKVKPGMVRQLPGSGAKAWPQDKKAFFWSLMDKLYDRAPGVVERAVLYRPIRVYLAKDPKFRQLKALALTNEILLADWLFYKHPGKSAEERDTLAMQPLLHELFHLAEPFQSVSYSAAWQKAVKPRIQKVRDHFKAKGMSIYEARASSKTHDEHDHIAHAQGLPYLWAAHASYEALAETGATMVVQKHIDVASDMQTIIRKNLIEKPKQKEPAKEFAHAALTAWEKQEPKKAVDLFTKAEKAGDVSTWGNFYAMRAKFWMSYMFTIKNGGLKAIADLGKATSIMAFDGPEELLRHAHFVGLTKKPDKNEIALKDYSAYLDVHVYHMGALLGRAGIYEKQKDYKNAVKDYDRVLQREPKSKRAYYAYAGRGKSKFGLKQFDGALADINHALSLEQAKKAKDLHQLYYLRGEIYRTKGDSPKAIENYSAVLQIQKKHYWALGRRSFEYAKVKDFKKAKADYETMLKYWPKNLLAIVSLAKLAKREGDTATANKLMQEARTIDKDMSEKLDKLINFGSSK